MQSHLIQTAKSVTDVVAYGTVFATLLDVLPAISSLFAIVWFGMQMIEKITGTPFHQLVRCVWRRIFG